MTNKFYVRGMMIIAVAVIFIQQVELTILRPEYLWHNVVFGIIWLANLYFFFRNTDDIK